MRNNMHDLQKTKKELIQELELLRKQVQSMKGESLPVGTTEDTLKLFRSLIDHSNDAIEVIDPVSLRYLDVNEKACSDLGYSREEFLSLTVYDVDPNVTPTSYAGAEEMKMAGYRIIQSTHKRKDGSLFPVEVNIKYVSLDRDYLVSVVRDITERKIIEEALRESEERFKLIANFTHDWEYWIAPDLTFVFTSPSSEQITGYTSDEFYRRPSLLEEIIFDDDRKFMNEHFHRQLDDPKPFSADFRILTKSGEMRWLNHSCQPIWSKEGTWIGQRASNRDITLRKNYENALQESEARNRALLNAIPDWIFLQTKDGVYIDYHATDTTGMAASPNEFIGKNMFDIFPLYLAKHFMRHFENVFQSRSLKTLEYDYHGKEGLEHYEARSVPIDEQRVLTIVRNITERKRLEIALKESERDLLDAQSLSHIGCWKWDFLTNTVRWSDEMFLLFGISKEEFDGNIEHVIEKAVHPDDKPKLYDANKKVRQNLTPVPLEYRIVLPDGKERIVFAEGRMVRDKHNYVTGIAGTVQDITERKQHEEALTSNEELLRNIVDGTNAILFNTTTRGILIYVNEAACRSIGLSQEEMVGSHYLRWVHPHDKRRVDEVLINQVRTRLPHQYLEFRFIREDETEGWYSFTTNPIIRNGEVVLMSGIAQEITERKTIEFALHRRERILVAVGKSAELLVKSHLVNDGIQEAITTLGKATDSSRVYIFENHLDEEKAILTSQRFEWVAEGIVPQIENPDLQNFRLKDFGFLRWIEMMLENKPVYGNIKDFPDAEREVLSAQDIKSIVVMPIFIGQTWWGFIGFDDCVTEREWSLAEIEALHAAAGMLGAAILHQSAELILAEQERQYRTLFNLAPVGILVEDKNGTILQVNTTLCEALGYTSEEIVGKRIHTLAPPPAAREIDNHIREILSGKTLTHEVQTIKKEGTLCYMELYETPMTLPDHEPGILVIAKDITERKQNELALLNSEVSYRGLFDSVSDAIYIQDIQGKFLDVNNGAEKMYDYPREFFIGKTPEVLSAPGKNDMQKIFEHVQKAFQGIPQRFEFWGIRSNGEVFPKDVVLNPGTYFGQPVLIALARDITERKQMEAEREQLVKQLRDAIANIKTLGGLLPICAGCKNIRDDKGYWQRVESYLMEHTDATFTHGMCPTCAKKYFPEYRSPNSDNSKS
ncbi:MAG: PAS domain S-box protein [Ignavibacteriae bacterium]|nr:PAS domain S-box protein [Ignavibacteriota bacterium]